MKKHNIRICGLALLFLTLICMQAQATDWTTFQKDNYNSGITNDAAPISMSDSADCWATKVGSINTAPLIVGDIVYIASGAKVVALYKDTGTILWQANSGMNLGNPAYGNDTIFVPLSGGGKMYAFNATTGDKKWEIDLNNIIYRLNTPVVYEDHMIYFGYCEDWGGNDGKYCCYHDNGTPSWAFEPSTGAGYYYAGAAIVGDYLIFGDSKEHLTSLNKYDGSVADDINVSEVWQTGTNGRIRSSVMYNGDTLYFSSESGYCYSVGFNHNDGTFDTQNKAMNNIGKTSSSPVYYNDRIYIGQGTLGDDSSKVCCLDSGDLSTIWSFVPEGEAYFQSSPCISTALDDGDGEIYIYLTSNTADGSLYCLKDINGNTEPIFRYKYTPPAGQQQFALGSAVISDGMLYYGVNEAGPNGGYIFGITPETWNPWNDPGSGGGEYITIGELIAAYNCYTKGETVPETGATINIGKLISIYNAYNDKTPM